MQDENILIYKSIKWYFKILFVQDARRLVQDARRFVQDARRLVQDVRRFVQDARRKSRMLDDCARRKYSYL